MDAHHAIGKTAAMDMTLKNQIAELLAQARDITQDTLGSLPPTVVAEVFRQLCMSLDTPPQDDDAEETDAPHALH